MAFAVSDRRTQPSGSQTLVFRALSGPLRLLFGSTKPFCLSLCAFRAYPCPLLARFPLNQAVSRAFGDFLFGHGERGS